MPLNIISNFAANVAHRNLTMSDSQATSSLAKLSAGTRVLSAKDDAASMAIGARLKTEVAGLKQAAVNAGQAVSMLQIADGAMAKVNDILTRMKTLSVQAGSEQLAAAERAKLDSEYQALVSEVDRVAADTEFSGTLLVNGGKDVTQSGALSVSGGVQDIVLLGSHDNVTQASVSFDSGGGFTVATNDGTNTVSFTAGDLGTDVTDGSTMSTGTVVTLTNANTNDTVEIALNMSFDADQAAINLNQTVTGTNVASFTFKVGTGVSETADDITVEVNAISATALGVSNTDLSTSSAADTASLLVSSAIDSLQNARANVGASQNRLEFATANLATVTENTEAARSQLLDLDVAAEMSNFTSKQILVQAGVSMLAQANQMPQQLLRLFQ